MPSYPSGDAVSWLREAQRKLDAEPSTFNQGFDNSWLMRSGVPRATGR